MKNRKFDRRAGGARRKGKRTKILNVQKQKILEMQLAAELTLRDVQQILGREDIAVITLKGPFLGNIVYSDPLDRPYCDLDLLVKPGDFDEAISLLSLGGFKQVMANRRRIATEEAYYNRAFSSPHGVRVELHWDLSSHRRYPVDTEQLFGRAVRFKMGDTTALGFSTEDLLLHLCIHIVMTYFIVDEKHFRDIALLVDRRPIDWSFFLDLVQKAKCTVGTYYVLNSVKRIHGATVPEMVLDALKPGIFRRIWLERHLNTEAFPVYKLDNERYLGGQLLLGLPLVDELKDWGWLILRYTRLRIMDLIASMQSAGGEPVQQSKGVQ